jgi:MoxR-like ATPase
MSDKEPITLLQPAEILPYSELLNKLLEQLDQILLGRSQLHRMVVVGILSQGHILLEGLPGLGKTALVKALGQLLQLEFKRVQFTPDLMPGDILGTHILQEVTPGKREMVFQPGPVFANILLADEINRASPKTQSALLEAMQERSVTLMGRTRPLPCPFFVLASQNPIELEGTYPLPEAQLDRFLFKLIVTDVDIATLDKIISTRRHGEPPIATWNMKPEELQSLFRIMDKIFLPKPVSRYIARLVAATHAKSQEATDKVRQYVLYGASPRAAIGIAEAARAHALLAQRVTVGFEDVQAVSMPVLNHRVILNYKARFDQIDCGKVMEELLKKLTPIALPDQVETVEPSHKE